MIYTQAPDLNLQINPKKFCQYVSSQDHNRQGIRKPVTEEGEEITNINKLANSLNQQFVSVFTTEPDGPLPSSPEYIVKSPMKSITQFLTEVLRCLQKLDSNKLQGPDNLHPRLLKETAAIIAELLRRIFQTSLTSRKLQADWKIASITPVFKKGNCSKPENYWPISLTLVVLKILEHIVNDSILKHLTTNKILSPKQHGFQSGKLIETNLLESYKEITDLIDHGHLVDLLLLDFAKAFDKVPQSQLHSNISTIGINQAVVDWLMNFLKNCKQKVLICYR